MKGIALNNQHDIYVEEGRLAVVNEEFKVGQDVKTRLLSVQGEFVLDREYGMRYYDLTATERDLSLIESEIKAMILETQGIDSLLEFFISGDKETRTLSVKFTAKTVYGNTITEEVALNARYG